MHQAMMSLCSQKLLSHSNSNKTMVLVLLYLLHLSCSTLNLSHITKLSDLNKYICDPDNPLLTYSQLFLSLNMKHIISSNSFYLMSNILTITLHSSSIASASIICRHYNNSYESVGLDFYNLSWLMIENINITQSGYLCHQLVLINISMILYILISINKSHYFSVIPLKSCL